MTHKNIEIDGVSANAIWEEIKPFVILDNDRAYQKGDYITFKVIDENRTHVEGYDIEEYSYLVTYVVSGSGLKENVVALAIKKDLPIVTGCGIADLKGTLGV